MITGWFYRRPIQARCLPSLALAFVAALSPTQLPAQTARIQIIVERRVGKTVQRMSSQHVFSAGDLVRFRFRSSSAGYLYVSDQSTSGKYLTLFPGPATGEVSKIKAGVDYLVPATAGSWFRVDNPPGYEKLFFLISPTELKRGNYPPAVTPEASPSPDATPPPNPQSPQPSSDLLPRCNDEIFKARGDCTDVLAGPRKIQPGEKLPPAGLPEAGSREVTVINKPTSSLIEPADSSQAPFVYEFRLAHH